MTILHKRKGMKRKQKLQIFSYEVMFSMILPSCRRMGREDRVRESKKRLIFAKLATYFYSRHQNMLVRSLTIDVFLNWKKYSAWHVKLKLHDFWTFTKVECFLVSQWPADWLNPFLLVGWPTKLVLKKILKDQRCWLWS